MRPVFRDSCVQQVFEQSGFVVLPILSAKLLEDLSNFLNKHKFSGQNAFYTSTDLNDINFRRDGDLAIRAAFLSAGLDQWVDRYELFFSSFIIKSPCSAGDSTVALHADWSIHDETSHYALTLWFPLQDVDVMNGCMHVLPGSHLKMQRIRGVGIPERYRRHRDLFKWSDLVPIPMRAGQVLCYHNALLHASPPNLTNQIRAACLVPCYPSEVNPVLYYKSFWSVPGQIKAYPVSLDFFSRYDKRSRPDGLPVANRIRYTAPRYSRSEFLNYRTSRSFHVDETYFDR